MTKIVFPRCLELISGRLEDPVNFGKFGLKKGTGVDFFTVFLLETFPLGSLDLPKVQFF